MFSKKDLKRLIIPLMIEQTLALTVGMIDTVMVSGVGESAVSGVSLVENINVLLINLFSALATGGAIVAGQYLGRDDKESGRHAAKQLVMATFMLSSVIMIVCLILNNQMISLFFGRIDNDVMTSARTYFYITALSYPFIAVYNASAALFRGMGNSRISMTNAFIMNLVNIIGNSILIYGLDMGVAGAAIATTISRIFAASSMIYMLRNKSMPIFVRSYNIKQFDFGMVRKILRIGIPNGLENSMFQIGKIIVAGLVSIQGTAAIAANAVGNSVAGVAMIPGSAMGLALTTVVAQCVGAGRYDEANKYMKYLIRLAYTFMIILNIVIIIFLRPILSIYNLSEETMTIAYQLLMLHSILAMFIWPLSFSLPNAFRAAGDVKFTMVIAIISMWTFRIGLSYFFVYQFDMGVLGVWIAMTCDWAFRSLCFVIRWVSGKWRKAAVV